MKAGLCLEMGVKGDVGKLETGIKRCWERYSNKCTLVKRNWAGEVGKVDEENARGIRRWIKEAG